MTLQQPKQSLTRIAFRFVAGRSIDGIHRTDSTFLRHASRDLTVHGRASRWAHRPGWHRTGYRLGTIGAVFGAWYGWTHNRTATLAALGSITLAVTCFAAWRIRRTALAWSHNRHVVYPLWHVLAGLTGYPLTESRYASVPGMRAGHRNYAARERPEKFLTIPRDYRDNDKAIVRFEIPYTWEASIQQQKAVTSLMSRRLGGDWAASWYHDASPRYVQLVHAPEPPQRVTLAAFKSHIDACPANVLALGIGVCEQLISIDMDSEAPHIALSMGTGGGKSDTVALVIASLVRKGCERIDVIDPKRVSHNWARGLPGVHIHRYVQGQMTAIHNARLVMDSRYDALDTDDSLVFSRHVLIIEEQNSLIEDLEQYWDDYRRELSSEERGRTSRINPAITDLRYILNKGRQSRINVISIYQRMSAKAAGGGDARSQYGAKILARFDHQTWKMLVGTTPVPRSSRIPGRAIFVLGDEQSAVQRAYAGIAKPDGSADKEGIARLRAFALNDTTDAGGVRPDAVTVLDMATGDPAELVTLREACESGTVSLRYGALVKARSRDPEFPAGIARGNAVAYRTSDLASWEANRLRARAVA